MDDRDAVSILRQFSDRPRAFAQRCRIFQRGASDFDHDRHCSPSSSPHPYIRFMFCTAWPAAPFSRLSMHEISTSRRPSSASAKSEVAIVRVQRELHLRQLRRLKYPHPPLARIKSAEARLHFQRGHTAVQVHIDRRENPSRNRQQMRCKGQFARAQFKLLDHLSHMPVVENRIGRQIVSHRNEMRFRRRLFARSGYSGLRVGNNPTISVNNSRLQAAAPAPESPTSHSNRDLLPSPRPQFSPRSTPAIRRRRCR